MTISVVGRRGTVTIPAEIRRKIKLEEGDHIAFTLDEDVVVLRPIRKTFLDFYGSVNVPGPQDFDAVRKTVLESRAGRHVSDGE
jgi:antitoxin PrlF